MLSFVQAARGVVLLHNPTKKLAVVWPTHGVVTKEITEGYIHTSGDLCDHDCRHIKLNGMIVNNTYAGCKCSNVHIMGTKIQGTYVETYADGHFYEEHRDNKGKLRYYQTEYWTVSRFSGNYVYVRKKHIGYDYVNDIPINWEKIDQEYAQLLGHGERDYETYSREALNLIAERRDKSIFPSDPDWKWNLFVAAMSGFDVIETNNIENLVQVLDVVKDIIRHKKNGASIVQSAKDILNNASDTKFTTNEVGNFLLGFPKSIKKKGKLLSATQTSGEKWLAKRYAFDTTRSDIEELYDELGIALNNWEHYFDYQRVVYATRDVGVCKVVAKPRATNAVGDLYLKSKGLGLQLNAQNIWDLVPYSFVVDWFLPAQEICETVDSAMMYNETHYTFDLISFSYKTSENVYCGDEVITITQYQREVVLEPPPVGMIYSNDPSTKTQTYRAIDGAALVVTAL